MRTKHKRTFRHGRLSGQVLLLIENMIADRFPPGSLLPTEDELAGQFRVSRIVIREAMKMLEDRGLVEVRAGRGTTVVTPKPDRVKASLFRLIRSSGAPVLEEMLQLLELRGVLEENAASLAAARASNAEIDEIESALNRMRDGSVPEEVHSADLQFHISIARASGNRFFEIVLEPLTEVFLKQIQLSAKVDVGIKQHQDVLRAIQSHDPAAASVAVRRLLSLTQKDIRKALSSRPVSPAKV
ncbi:MAG TPA: FCD domain-containing protein [Candidatus Sulfotelmatobacter sp.]|nr:FCD domain-containing protein [Candidatus Sulfotelmatobacter sp.]